MQRFQNVVRTTRRCRETGVLEAIDADRQSTSNLFRAVRMRDDWKFARVRFVHDCFYFFHRHLVLVDQLDDVDAGVGKLLYLGFAVGCAFHAPAEVFSAGIGFVLNERTGDVKSGPGNFAAVDPVAHADALLERTTEIARAGHTGHEQLSRGGRHDLASHARRIRSVPMLVIAVAPQHRVYVAIPKAGQHVQRTNGAHLSDAVVFDYDHAVRERMSAKPIYQPSTDERNRACLRRGNYDEEQK